MTTLNRRQWLVAGLAFGLAATGLIFFTSSCQQNVSNRAIPPDNLSAYLLKAEDRQMLAAWAKLRGNDSPDSLREWVRRHYGPFQSIGLRLLDQAALFQRDGKIALAAAKIDTVRAIGTTLVETVQDSFLARQLHYSEKLDEKSSRLRQTATALFASAYDQLYAGRYKDARAQFEETAALAEQIHDDKLYADASSYLLYFLDRDGKYKAIVEMSKKIIARAEKAGYQKRLALMLCNIATAHRNLNDYSAALAYLNQAIQIAERIHDLDVLARCYYNGAKIHYSLEEYQQAEVALQKVPACDTRKKFGGLAYLLQGHIDVARGEYSRARSRYELARKFFQQYDLDRLNEAVALNSLSSLFLLIGEYENALRIEKEALALREAEGNAQETAESFSRLGFIYSTMDSLEQAIAMCERALPTFQANGKNFLMADTWLIIGDAYFKKDDLPAAGAAFANAEKIFTAAPNRLIEIETRIRHGRVFLKKRQVEPAMAQFSTAIALAQKRAEPSLIAEGLFGLSQAEQRLNHLERAAELIENAIAEIENLRSALVEDSVRVSYFATTQALFDQAILLALARGKDGLALHYAERARARALRDALGETTLKDLAKEQIEMVTAGAPNFPTLQQSIPVATQVIEYRLTPDTLLIWVIDRHKLVKRQVAITSPSLNQIVHKFLQSLGAENLDAFKARVTQDMKTVYDENCQFGRELYQLLWEPIADAIAPDSRLFIIPDGVLHRLPFGALRADDARFFEEKYIWAKAPSLDILAANSTVATSPTQPEPTRFLMIADAFASVNAQKKLLSRLFIDPTFLIKSEATFESLQARLQDGAGIVYFSVHAVADERYPMNSYLELYGNAGANGHLIKTKVYARELLKLNLSKTRLAVLNACETAGGRIAAGEGVLNLVRVFALGKVPVVIASLWRNDDRLSAQITNDFFREMAASPDHIAALHRAKINALQKLRHDYQLALPYFWAVFEVYQNSWVCTPHCSSTHQ